MSVEKTVKDRERRIIESIQKGDNDKVLSYLYDKPLKKIRKYVLSNSGSLDDANDVFQDAVVALFNQVRRGKYKLEYDLDAFLFKVAKNAWIDKARKEQRKVGEDAMDFQNISNSENHLNDIIEEEKLAAFRDVFNQLEDNCKKILTYAVFEKRSMKEIRDLMGYKHENVAKSQHYRCKQYFSKLLFSNKDALNLLKN